MTDTSAWSPNPLEPDLPWDAEESPASDQGHDGATPVTPPRRSRRAPWLGLLLGLLAVAVVGAAVWLLFLKPADAASADRAVVDLTDTPEAAWTYKYAPRGEEEWVQPSATVHAVGGDRFLVKADLELSAYYESDSGSSSWYPGYDAHYLAGFADGTRYREAVETYQQDPWGSSYPEMEDYFGLGGVSYSAAVNEAGAHQGWFDGFSDAEYDRGEGASQAQEPQAPPTLGHLAMIDRSTGEEVWRVETESLPFEAGSSTLAVLPLSTEGHVVTTITTLHDDAISTTVTALDPADGSVVSEVELDNAAIASGAAAGGPLIVLDEDGVRRLDTGDLGGDDVWSAGIPGIDTGSGAAVVDEYVQLTTEDGTWWLDAATGYEPEWFEGADDEVTYRVLEDVVLRQESSSFGYYLDALDRTGKTLWTGDAERVFTPDGSGGPALLKAESSDGGYEYLMRLDPRTGDPMWDTEYDDEFSWVTGTVPGGLVLNEGDRSVVVDLESGERGQRLRGSADYLGTRVVYGDEEGRLQAWDVEDGTALWSMRVSDTESLRRAGDALLVQDSARREISLLQ